MKWVLAEADEGLVGALVSKAGLHPLVARLMAIRGILDPLEARSFLACDLASLSEPGIFSLMDKAVDRIRRAIAGREKIVVYGDYDVDGVTGAAILYLTLKGLGADAGCYLPDRMTEGYGLNAKALDGIKASGAGLVISTDCGITAIQEAEHARTIGLDLIVTDHHEFERSGDAAAPDEPVLPNAYAVLHPRLLAAHVSTAVREQVAGLTGVGVAFKLAQALLGTPADADGLPAYLDLVALGTIADVGRITGENRVLIRHGLERLSSDDENARPGIAALKQVAGLNGKKIGVGNVGFTLAPRINASGRLVLADAAFRLLTTDSAEEALGLARELDAVNKERQAIEEAILNQAKEMCRAMDTANAGALVLSSDDWHSGVIGIVASRIVEAYYRPTALISIKDGIGKGSGRSIPGFDLYEGLSACADLLLGFGGHKYAAGFTIEENKIPEFRERLSRLVLAKMGPDGFVRTLCVDGAVTLDELTVDLLKELEQLAPFGQGNPEPRLGARGLAVVSSRIVGGNHLKLRLKQENGTCLGAIAFKQGGLLGNQVRDGARLAAVFTPRLNSWNGNTAVELEIRDIKTDTTEGKKV